MVCGYCLWQRPLGQVLALDQMRLSVSFLQAVKPCSAPGYRAAAWKIYRSCNVSKARQSVRYKKGTYDPS